MNVPHKKNRPRGGLLILIGVVIVLVLSASMSTLSSLVLTSSSTITLDFLEPLGKKKMGEKKKERWNAFKIQMLFCIW